MENQEQECENQKNTPRGRKLHQDGLKERPAGQQDPLKFRFFQLDRFPIHIFRVQDVARLRFRFELSPELLQLEAFRQTRPEGAQALEKTWFHFLRARWSVGHASCDYKARTRMRWNDAPGLSGTASGTEVCLRFLFGIIIANWARTGGLYFGKSEAVAQLVRSPRQAFELFAAFGIEQIKLRRAARERRQRHPHQPDESLAVPCMLKEFAYG